jgi:hypothetical protein
MSTLREAAQQALEALEEYQEKGAPFWACDAAVTALRAALAQQDEPKGGGNLPPPLQAEPVANASSWFALVMNAAAEIEDASHCLRDEAAKRVAISGAKHYRDAANALFAATPRREWQSLTDTDIARVFRAVYGGARFGPSEKEFAIAVESLIKEKNHG